MASAALSPYRNKKSMSDPRHMMRYIKHQAGMDIADIAKSEKVSAETVRQSIHQIEAYRAKSTSNEMDLALRDLVISSIPQAKETLTGLLAAMELVEKKDAKTGKVKVITVADKTTRLEALKVLNAFSQTMQPKTPMIQNNVSATAQAAANASVTAAETTEERFKRLREKAAAHNALPPEVAGVPDYIDAGGDASDVDDEDEDDGDDEE